MLLLQYNTTGDPVIEDEPGDLWNCVYNQDSRSRFNGLNEDGIGFINTSDVQDSYSKCGNKTFTGNRVGVVILSLDTRNIESTELSWKVKLIRQGAGLPQPREYRLQPQYRLNPDDDWKDFSFSNTYSSFGKQNGHSNTYTITLPEECINRPNIQIRWKYFQHEGNDGGSRPFISLDNIRVRASRGGENRPSIITSKNAIDILGALKGSFSRTDSIEIDGYGLEGKELFIKIPQHFEASFDKITWSGDSLPLNHNNGEIRSMWLFVRYNNAAAGLVNGQIRIQTIDDIFKIINVSGEIYPQLYFNELMAVNTKTIEEPQRKDYFDWIELYNPNGEDVDFTGWYISDNMENPTKYRFFINNSRRYIVSSNGFEIVWASGVTPASRFPMHLPFSLSSEGEQLILVGSDRKTIIDSISFGNQLSDISYGRISDGDDAFVQFNKPTPKSSNNTSTPIQGIVMKPSISPGSGRISNNTKIEITSADPDAVIVYTLDGSYPDINNLNGKSFIYKNKYVIRPGLDSIPGDFYLSEPYNSFIYQGPFEINELFTPNNQHLNVATNYNESETTPYPAGPVKKMATIRAVAYKDGFLPSAVASQTYLPEDLRFKDSLIIVNINIDPEKYYDYYKGIAVAGFDFDKWREENPYASVALWRTPGNFRRSGREWEINSEASFFVNNTHLFNENCGVRLHGRGSRTTILKGYRLYFRSEYGKEPVMFNNFLESPPYNNFHRFILKSRTNLRDIVGQQLSQGLNLYPQAMANASIFVNGQYHGIGYLLERQDEYYFKSRYQLEEGTLDIITNTVADEGSSIPYNRLLAFFRENDFTNQAMYDSATALIDINNYIDYYSAEIFLHNVDWPGNNVKLWRYNQPDNNPRKPYGWDGKWRWILFDLDGSLNHDGFRINRTIEDNISRALNQNCPNQWCTIIFSKLTTNNQFKNQFTARLCDLMNTFYKTERINFFIDRNRNLIDGELNDHFIRTGDNNLIRWPGRYDTYEINPMREFARLRHAEVRKHLRSNFGYQGEANITLHVDDYQKGYIKINTIEINEFTPGVDSQPYPWKGTYVTPLQVSLIPLPREGFKFDFWEIGDSTNYNDTLNFTFRNTVYAKAYFTPDTAYRYFPEPYDLVGCPYYFDNWPAKSAIGTYPPNMAFYSTRFPDSGPNGELEGILDSIAYDHDTQTRINGLSASGLSFTNSNDANNYYLPTRLGAAVVAVNTEKINAATVTWTGGTVRPNSKEYAIRLQYRIGEKGPFKDLQDENGEPIEYRRNQIAGHKEVIGPHTLPSELMGRPCVQLAWRYYYTGVQNNRSTEARDQLSVDDIIIGQKPISGIKSTGPYSANLIGADGGMNYQWFMCRQGIPVMIENATEKMFEIRKAGEYALSIDYGECVDTSACEYFFVKEYISLLPGIKAMIYPNPATSTLNVLFSGEVNDVEVSILDMDGRVISSQFSNKQALQLSFDINKLPAGVYILRASTREGKTGNTKFIKL